VDRAAVVADPAVAADRVAAVVDRAAAVVDRAVAADPAVVVVVVVAAVAAAAVVASSTTSSELRLVRAAPSGETDGATPSVRLQTRASRVTLDCAASPGRARPAALSWSPSFRR
jgi:hypothetical protein